MRAGSSTRSGPATPGSATTCRTSRRPGSGWPEASGPPETTSRRPSSTSPAWRSVNGERDQHGRFPGTASCLDPLDPPVERLRRKLGLEPPRWAGAHFAVCSRTTSTRPGAGRRSACGAPRRDCATPRVRAAAARPRGRRARSPRVPLHKLRGTDPNWRFERILRIAQARGVAHTFYLMAGHRHPADGAAPHVYERLRPRLVEALLAGGAEIGLHGSYTAADDLEPARRGEARARGAGRPARGSSLPLPARRPAPEPGASRRARLPLRHEPRLLRPARLPRGHRTPVSSLGRGSASAPPTWSRSRWPSWT